MSIRAELEQYLREQGATDEQIAHAAALGHLPGLAADLVFMEGVTFSAADLAARLGEPVERIIDGWRLLGVNVTDPERVAFSEDDAQMIGLFVGLGDVTGFDGDDLLRIMGTSLARIADAAVAQYVQTSETDLLEGGGSELEFARQSAETARLAGVLGDAMGLVFIHHLRDAVRRQRISQHGTVDKALSRLTVGFVDLVGFTPLTRVLSPRELAALVTDFETRAFDVAADHDGRVVKHIGDEIMFVALDSTTGCRLARALFVSFADAGIEPRGGLACGDVLTRHGDYYGPVVNLASRLTDEAVPGEVLVDDAVVAGAEGIEFEPAGRRQLKGFDAPIRVHALLS